MGVRTVSETALILSLFKGKGLKAYLKDNYRGITMLPTLRKIYETILLKRIEKLASERNFFSDLQFGFKEGVGCIEASFTVLETTNHIIERGGKVFACYLDVKKLLALFGLMDCCSKFFFDMGGDSIFWLNSLTNKKQSKDLCGGERVKVMGDSFAVS